MNELRFQELVDRVVDDEINVSENQELAAALRSDPARLADLQFHLALWELFSQQHSKERGADAFVAAFQTRLAAETRPADFVERTIERLGPEDVTESADLPDRLSLWQGLLDTLRAFATRRWAIGVASVACLAFLVGISFCFFGPTMGQPVLAEVQGTGLLLERAGQPLAARPGMRLEPGDVLRTRAGVTASVIFTPEQTRIALLSGSEFKMVSSSRGKRFDLLAGKLQAAVARQRPFRSMVLTTPQAEARVLGTKFSLQTTPQSTRLEVTEGTVRLARLGGAESTKVSAGHYAIVATNAVLAPLPLTGSIYREYWTNIPGEAMTYLFTHPNYPDRPDGHEFLTNLTVLEMPSDRPHGYGEKLRGYVHPPRSGDYTFWISGQADASLFLSPDDNPEHRVHMAHCFTARRPQDWDLQQPQVTEALPLVAGKRYYFEVVHQAGAQNDSLAVAWKGPGREREVIPSEFLSPFKPK